MKGDPISGRVGGPMKYSLTLMTYSSEEVKILTVHHDDVASKGLQKLDDREAGMTPVTHPNKNPS